MRSSPAAPPRGTSASGAQPVARGREHDVADADRRERRAPRSVAFLRSRGGEALAQAAAPRVDAQLPAGLRIDEPEHTDVRELLLARVADLDGEHLVPAGSSSSGLRQSSGPRKSETTTTSARWRAIAPARRSASPSDVAPTALLGLARSAVEQADEADAALARRQRARLGVAERRRRRAGSRAGSRYARSRSRPPPRRRPFAGRPCRTASTATCRARATSTSTRSARSTRTCGSPVRAVTFHSIRRTSSPATYGRICASSMPSPSRSSGSRRRAVPRTRRPIVMSSARSSRPGIGPGPGRSGVGDAQRARADVHAALTPREIDLRHGHAASTWSRIESGVTSSASAW